MTAGNQAPHWELGDALLLRDERVTAPWVTYRGLAIFVTRRWLDPRSALWDSSGCLEGWSECPFASGDLVSYTGAGRNTALQ
jgi:hypothetical protein